MNTKIPKIDVSLDLRRKIMPEDILEIRKLRKKGMSYQRIANLYCLCIATIFEHCNPERYLKKRKIKIMKNLERYKKDKDFRSKFIKETIRSKNRRKCLMPEYEEEIINSIKSRYSNLREKVV